MSKRLMFILLFIITASIGVIPAQAASTPWTAWLYENQVGRMTQIDSNGNMVKEVQLPAAQGEGYSQNVAVSQDGLLVTYGGTSPTTNNVYIYDLATNSNVFEFNVPLNAATSFDFSGGPLSYDENHETFAFSYGGFGFQWTLVVINIKTFTTTSLKQSDPAAVSLLDNESTFIPAIVANRNKQVTFLLIPYGIDGAPTYKGFTWSQDTNTVAPNLMYNTLDSTTFAPTNEVISLASNDGFPGSQMPDTGFPVNNTLQVFDPKVNQRSIVTSLPNLFNPQFIQGGERVALGHFEVLASGEQTQSLMVLDRSGAVVGTVNGVPSTGINSVLGTQDGFVFSYSSGGNPQATGTNLYYVETRQANGVFNAVSVWSSSTPEVNGQLVWVSDSTPASTTTFQPWGQVQAPPPSDGSGVPAGGSAYAVGATVQVQTTANDVLNLRSGPGVSFERLGIVAHGIIVTLVEGPVSADGFTWWRVRLPTGVEGWVVSQADGVNTLIPR